MISTNSTQTFITETADVRTTPAPPMPSGSAEASRPPPAIACRVHVNPSLAYLRERICNRAPKASATADSASASPPRTRSGSCGNSATPQTTRTRVRANSDSPARAGKCSTARMRVRLIEMATVTRPASVAEALTSAEKNALQSLRSIRAPKPTLNRVHQRGVHHESQIVFNR